MRGQGLATEIVRPLFRESVGGEAFQQGLERLAVGWELASVG